jgi:hypothetical protein
MCVEYNMHTCEYDENTSPDATMCVTVFTDCRGIVYIVGSEIALGRAGETIVAR